MAVPNYYICDICGKPVPKEARMVLSVGYDPLNQSETIFDIIDICHLCCVNVINHHCRDNREMGSKISQIVNTFKQRFAACHPTKST